MSLRLSHPLPPIAQSFALASKAAGVPYIGQVEASMLPSMVDDAMDSRVGDNGGRQEQEAGTCATELHRLPLPRQLEEIFDDAFPIAEHTFELWDRCSMVVGMHPDEATEPIVDLCLRSGKAFAIVPCCVFPETNRHRQMADGSAVRTWEQFISFL